jgi:hypothetical protein
MKLCVTWYVWMGRKDTRQVYGGALGSAWGSLASIAGNYEDIAAEPPDLTCDLEAGWLPASLVPDAIPGKKGMDPIKHEVCPVYVDGNLVAYLIRRAT